MDSITDSFSQFGPAIFIPIAVVLAAGIMGQWMLYTKCGLPGISAIVPFWNVIVFLKIMGRPASHFWYFLIPFYNIYFVVKLYIELCNCFGKNRLIDYIICLTFNGLYVLHLGLSPDEEYRGTVYHPDLDALEALETLETPPTLA